MMRSSRQQRSSASSDSRQFLQCETVDPCVSGSSPTPRHAFDICELAPAPQRGGSRRFVLVGGWCRGECNNVQKDHYYSDAHLLDVQPQYAADGSPAPLLRWTLLNTTGSVPTARANFTLSCSDGKLFLFGGGLLWTNGIVFGQLHVLDPETWEWSTPHTSGKPPAARQSHTANVLPNGDILYFGGYDGITNFNDVHILSPRSMHWSQPTIEGRIHPPGGCNHSATLVGDSLYVFGGASWNDHVADVKSSLYKLNIETWQWQQVRQTGAVPHSRFAHAAFELYGKLVVHGGWGFLEQGDQAELDQWEDESLYFSDCRVFDPRTNEWQDNESLQRIFGQKFSHKVIRVQNMLLSILGHNGTVPMSDVSIARVKELAFDHIIPPSAMSSDMSELLRNQTFCDVVFVCGEEAERTEFPAHRCVVAARCPLLASMLTAPFQEKDAREIVLHDCPPSAFAKFLQYLYSDHPSDAIAHDNVVEILALADKFQSSRLKSACEVALAAELDLSNVVDVLRYADLYSADNLYNACIRFAAWQYDAVIASPDFTKLRKENAALAGKVVENVQEVCARECIPGKKRQKRFRGVSGLSASEPPRKGKFSHR